MSSAATGAATFGFTYSPLGSRIRQTSAAGTTIYAYDDENIVAQYEGAGVLVARYSYEGLDEPLKMLNGTTASYFQGDALESVTSITSDNASTLTSYVYDSFGALVSSTGSSPNPLRYTARELGVTSGTYYYRARYYDSEIGRFISEDPSGMSNGSNLFTYVNNNPLLYSDPLGLYKLEKFPSHLEAEMKKAIEEAIEKLRGQCCAGPAGEELAELISRAKFIYKPKAGYCGQVGPLGLMRLRKNVAIGAPAFSPICCSLASVIAHEAVHLQGQGDDPAYELEKKCWGCNDPRDKEKK